MKKALEEAGQVQNIQILEAVAKTFLFDGYKEYFLKLIPRPNKDTGLFDYVFCHNDC